MREDNGAVYKCKVQNNLGSAEANASITVLCEYKIGFLYKTKQNKNKNETKRNETKRNKTKQIQNKTKQNKTKQRTFFIKGVVVHRVL